MLIAMIITGGVAALAAQIALGQLRHFQGIGALVGLRAQIGHSAAIAARALWSVSPAAGDIIVALDSAIEFHSAIGSAVVCDGTPGSITIPRPTPENGNTLSAFWDAPASGDRVHTLFNDSLGAGWLTLHVAAPPIPGPACVAFSQTDASWLIMLREPIAIPRGAPTRFTRAARLSVYRASNNLWYLGATEWNGTLERFNTIQPVAGPLRPYSHDASQTGLVFRYRGADGAFIPPPADPALLASITVTSRAETEGTKRTSGFATSDGRYVDSISVAVALRNVP
jgi:hypothetical protein